MNAVAPAQGRGWRWRRCPVCGSLERASDFAVLQLGPAWQNGETQRAYPNCGHRGPTWAFKVVRERHA